MARREKPFPGNTIPPFVPWGENRFAPATTADDVQRSWPVPLLIAIFFVTFSVILSCVDGSPRPEAPSPEGKAAPIILVHGFAGWGRSEIPGFYYWGGFDDLQSQLRESGYRVFTAAVGPFSSNWDRACELYACIKGGTVDYGAAHAAEYGHARFGRSYPGLYPEWDEEHPVHLIGHSMGGQTARLLAHLIRYGSTEERAEPSSHSPLFDESPQRVHSIVTLSTPHNGTTLVKDIGLIENLMSIAVSAIAVAIDRDLTPELDLQLGHWGIERRENEEVADYFSRVRRHPIWLEGEEDFSLWDVSPEGAAELNREIEADPEIYYFSSANEETTEGLIRNARIPEITMLSIFYPGAIFMGSYTQDTPIRIDREWWANDGVVNTISMSGPFLNSSDRIVDRSDGFGLGDPEPGVWQFMGTFASLDHANILGIYGGVPEGPTGFASTLEFYRYIADLVLSLS